MQVFGRPEVQGDDFRRRIVDGAEPGHPGPALLEPVERTAIELEQLPGGRFARPARPMLRRPAAMDRGQAQGPPQPPHRLPGDGQAMVLPQFLGDVRVIEARIAIPQQRLDLPTDGRRQAPMRRPPPAGVPQRQGPALPKALLETLKLPGRHVQGRRPLPIGNPTRNGRGHQARPG